MVKIWRYGSVHGCFEGRGVFLGAHQKGGSSDRWQKKREKVSRFSVWCERSESLYEAVWSFPPFFISFPHTVSLRPKLKQISIYAPQKASDPGSLLPSLCLPPLPALTFIGVELCSFPFFHHQLPFRPFSHRAFKVQAFRVRPFWIFGVSCSCRMGAVMAVLSVEARRRFSRPSCLSHCTTSAARYHRSGRSTWSLLLRCNLHLFTADFFDCFLLECSEAPLDKDLMLLYSDFEDGLTKTL